MDNLLVGFILIVGLIVLFFAIQVAILRWILRINHIIQRLDRIIDILLKEKREGDPLSGGQSLTEIKRLDGPFLR